MTINSELQRGGSMNNKNMRKVLFSIITTLLLFIGIVENLNAAEIKTEDDIRNHDFVRFGSYNGQPLLWNIINIDGNGVLLVTSDNMTAKAFDASGDPQIFINKDGTEVTNPNYNTSYGSNYWETSNIREWLNSTEDIVSYTGLPPTADRVQSDAYDDEAGFLTNFTSHEQAYINEVNHTVLIPKEAIKPEYDVDFQGTEEHIFVQMIEDDTLQNYDEAYKRYLDDKVFLLSLKEYLELVQPYESIKRYYTSDKAINYYAEYLRTPGGAYGFAYSYMRNAKIAAMDYMPPQNIAAIRPALYLKNNIVFRGSGTPGDPLIPSLDSRAQKIIINGQAVENFDSNQYEYNITLPYNTAITPSIEAVLKESTSTYTVTPPIPDALEGDFVVTVTALDSTTSTYILHIDLEEPPSNDSSLNKIIIDGAPLHDYQKEIFNYTYSVNYGAVNIPEVSVETSDINAMAIINAPDTLPGYIVIDVTAEDGTQAQYIIDMVIKAPSSNTLLSQITVDGLELDGFDPLTYQYTRVQPTDVITIPVVTAKAIDPLATVDITYPTTLPGTVNIKVTAEDSTFTTYNIHFKYLDSNSDASSISIDGQIYTTFSKSIYHYVYKVSQYASTVPRITATAYSPSATVLITQSTGVPGQASITIVAEDESQSTYILDFIKEKVETTSREEAIIPKKTKEEKQQDSLQQVMKDMNNTNMEESLEQIRDIAKLAESSEVAEKSIEAMTEVIKTMDQETMKEDGQLMLDVLEEMESVIHEIDKAEVIVHTKELLEAVDAMYDDMEQENMKEEMKETSIGLAREALATTLIQPIQGKRMVDEQRSFSISINENMVKKQKNIKDQAIEELSSVDLLQESNSRLETIPIEFKASGYSTSGDFVYEIESRALSHSAIKLSGHKTAFTVDDRSFSEEGEQVTYRIKQSVDTTGVPVWDEDVDTLDTPVLDFRASTKENEDITHFNEPIKTAFKVEPHIVQGLSEEELQSLTVFYYDEEAQEWQPVGGKYNSLDGTIETRLPHFSKYTVMLSNKSFVDVNQHYAKKEINIMLRKGIIPGDKKFIPTQRLTRGEFCSWLTKAFNLQVPKALLPFEDVPVDHIYYNDIAAAYEKELIHGVDDVTFDPEGYITRQEIAALMTRAMERYKDYEELDNPEDTLKELSDKELIALWAENGVATALFEDAINLYPQQHFKPLTNTKKEEAAVLIYTLYYKDDK